MGMTK